MKPWKKFQLWIADYLNWKYITKKHYGDSVPDVKGDGFVGECKHFKAMRIHTLLDKTEALYHTGIILFTKIKGTHYAPENVIVSFRLGLFKEFLDHHNIVLNLPDKIKKEDKRDLVSEIKYKFNIIEINLKGIEKIFKKIEKK